MLWIQYWVVGVNHDGEDVLMESRSSNSLIPLSGDVRLNKWHHIAMEESQPHYKAYQIWMSHAPLTSLIRI